jgi:hypothetical protein
MKQPENEQALETVTGGDPDLKMLIEHYKSATDTERAKIKKLFPSEEPFKPAPLFREGLKNLTQKQRGMLDNQNHESFPVNDTNRYQDKLNNNVEEAVKDHKSTMQKISFSPVRKTPSNNEARDFLYHEYEGHCQITGTTFPKARKNASGNANNFFEACSLLSYANAEYFNNANKKSFLQNSYIRKESMPAP